jgi:predicted nucleic acid-binding protein
VPIRLLGDAVLRRRTWNLAEQLGWAETYDAEYVAQARSTPSVPASASCETC